MRKGRKNKTILLTMLVVAITSMTIVFAAMSTTLKIKGSGLLSADAWNIKFENLASVTLKGSAEETTAPTIKADTEIGDFSVVLKRTGDEVVYNFDIHNYGKLNAKIEELNISTPVCTGNAEDEAQKIADAQTVSESLTYTLTYSDGVEVKVGDTLKAEEVKSLTLKLAYTGENMPSDSVQITGLEVSIKHAQDMSTEEPEVPVEPATLAGKRFNEETKVIIDDKVVTIPGGATISALPGEYESVDDGLVMYVIPEGTEVTDWNADTNSNGILDVQENYDQFVWVPVETAVLDLSGNVDALSSDDNIRAETQLEVNEGRYPMAVKIDEDNYSGVKYSIYMPTGSNYLKISVNSAWTPLAKDRYFEPQFLSNDSTNDVGMTEKLLQEEFNNMVEKVSMNKGFWVGRYETSNFGCDVDSNKIQQVDVVRGIESITVNWYRFYAQQKNYSNLIQTESTSSMIYGCQWNQIMIWMKDIKNISQDSYYVCNSLGMGVFNTWEKTNKLILTGYYDEHKVKNIYDMAGNQYEVTQEGSANSRIMYGGSRNEEASGRGVGLNSQASYNITNLTSSDQICEVTSIGTRMVLY